MNLERFLQSHVVTLVSNLAHGEESEDTCKLLVAHILKQSQLGVELPNGTVSWHRFASLQASAPFANFRQCSLLRLRVPRNAFMLNQPTALDDVFKLRQHCEAFYTDYHINSTSRASHMLTLRLPFSIRADVLPQRVPLE